jgi:hypothetical protein
MIKSLVKGNITAAELLSSYSESVPFCPFEQKYLKNAKFAQFTKQLQREISKMHVGKIHRSHYLVDARWVPKMLTLLH